MIGDDIRGTLTELLTAELARDDAFACVKIELVYQPPADYRREVLRTWRREDPRDASAFEKNEIYRDKLVSTLIDLAEQRAEAEGMSGRKMFRTVLHQANGERVTRTFALAADYGGQENELARDEATLTPTNGGVLSQVMRHNEVLHKNLNKRATHDERMMAGMVNLLGAVTRNHTEQAERLWDRIGHLEDQRMKTLDTVEEAKSLQHQRLLEAKQVEAEESRKTMAWETLKDIGKAIAGFKGDGKTGETKSTNGAPTAGQAQSGIKDGSLRGLVLEFFNGLLPATKSELLERLSMELKMALAQVGTAAQSGNEESLRQALIVFFQRLDQDSIQMLEETLTGRQRRQLDRIFDILNEETPESPPKARAREKEDA